MRVGIAALLAGAFLLPASVHAQGTASDTALALRLHLTVFDSLRAEANRPQGIRKTVIKRLAARGDSLMAIHLKGITPIPVPPDTQPTPPDTTPPPLPVCVDEPVPDTVRGVAELPRVYLRGCFPTEVRTVYVPASASLQTALDTAKAGDQIELAQGTVYPVNLTWQRCLSAPVSIVTRGVVLPEGTRPDTTTAKQFARLVSPNISPVLLVKAGACGLNLSRVQVTATPQSATVNYNYALVRIGEGEVTVDAQPHDIVLDRVYVHGSDSTFTQNAVVMNGRRLTLRDSRIDHVRWKGVESHCVSGYAGVGPFRVTGNHLDCAGIGILFGGARRSVVGMGPTDIEIRRNYVTKDSSYIGYVAKNGVEMKDAQRVLIEANVIERSYYGAQTGMLLNLQSLTDEGDTTVQTTDVTVRYNRLRYGSQCFMASGKGYNGTAKSMSRVLIEHNLCTETGSDSLSRVTTMSGPIVNLTVRHNTFVRNDLPIRQQAVIPDGGPATGFVWQDNVYGSGQLYGCAFRSGGQTPPGGTGWAAWSGWAADAKVAGNVCWADAGSKTPSGNWWAATMADVGFAADWSLAATSPYKGRGTDGTDPGADIPTLTRRIAGVAP